jgi:hypothetical protein
MRKFVVVVEKVSAPQQDAITNFVKAQGWDFWHWYENLWLVVDPTEIWTSQGISDAIRRMLSPDEINIMVLGVTDPMTYWGRAPQESWAWMQLKWGVPGR